MHIYIYIHVAMHVCKHARICIRLAMYNYVLCMYVCSPCMYAIHIRVYIYVRVCVCNLVYNLCIGNVYEHLEERQNRR